MPQLLTTVAADSIALQDSLQQALDTVAPWTAVSREGNAPWSEADLAHTPARHVTSWMTGVEAAPRQSGYGENSWLSSVIVVMLILLALNFNNYRRLFKSFSQDLLGIRRRSNAFDERTSNETRSYALIILMLSLSEGLLLFTSGYGTVRAVDDLGVFLAAMAFSGVALGLYLFQLCAYKVVGYTFTDSISSRQWLRGFNASQALLSVILITPALVALFYPARAQMMLAIGCAAYIMARMLFIYKGFRIFYTNLPSLLYFILYLCALEIAPLVTLGHIAREI